MGGCKILAGEPSVFRIGFVMCLRRAAFFLSLFFWLSSRLGVFVVYLWTRYRASYSTVVFRPPLYSVSLISHIHVFFLSDRAKYSETEAKAIEMPPVGSVS